MICKNCKNNNKIMARYCVHCGAKLRLPFYLSWWFWMVILVASVYVSNVLGSLCLLVFIAVLTLNIKYNKGPKSNVKSNYNSNYQAPARMTPIVRQRISVEPESIPKHTIHLSQYDKEPLAFEKIKPTNITVRSNLDKLGTFIVLDTETTGFKPPKDKIVEIAAIKFENWHPTEIFETLINPQRTIPTAASNVNHINDEMVKDEPLIFEVMDDFNNFVKSFNIVGHNLDFDLEFLVSSGAVFDSKTKYYDTLWLAQKVLTSPKTKVWNNDLGAQEYIDADLADVENYKLGTLADYYNIGDASKAHRAAYDAYVTGLIFKELASVKVQGKD